MVSVRNLRFLADCATVNFFRKPKSEKSGGKVILPKLFNITCDDLNFWRNEIHSSLPEFFVCDYFPKSIFQKFFFY